MIENEKDNFEKLKMENVITGDYLNLCKYLEMKQNIDKKESFSFSEYMKKEVARIKDLYFKDEYHTINKWISNYLLAKEYYKEHGTLITEVGEVYRIHGFILRIDDWLIRQRTLCRNNRLCENQIKLLDEIEMVWDLNRKLYKDKSESKEDTQKSA